MFLKSYQSSFYWSFLKFLKILFMQVPRSSVFHKPSSHAPQEKQAARCAMSTGKGTDVLGMSPSTENSPGLKGQNEANTNEKLYEAEAIFPGMRPNTLTCKFCHPGQRRGPLFLCSSDVLPEDSPPPTPSGISFFFLPKTLEE